VLGWSEAVSWGDGSTRRRALRRIRCGVERSERLRRWTSSTRSTTPGAPSRLPAAAASSVSERTSRATRPWRRLPRGSSLTQTRRCCSRLSAKLSNGTTRQAKQPTPTARFREASAPPFPHSSLPQCEVASSSTQSASVHVAPFRPGTRRREPASYEGHESGPYAPLATEDRHGMAARVEAVRKGKLGA
jgi:hypothetical protein